MFANVLQMFYFTCNHGLTDKNRTIVMETSADDELPKPSLVDTGPFISNFIYLFN